MGDYITVMLEHAPGWESRAAIITENPRFRLHELLFDSEHESNPDAEGKIAIAELLPLIMFSRGEYLPDVLIVSDPEGLDIKDLTALGTKIEGHSWLDEFA